MKYSFLRTLLIAFLAFFLVSCSAPRGPVEIVQTFISAVDSENLDAAYKLLPDKVVVGYGGGEEKTVSKAEARPLAEKLFKDYNFSLEASNFQMDGGQVYFSIIITDEKDEKSATCSCEATITDGTISRMIILFCNES